MQAENRVAIVIANYNGYTDTIQCLESLKISTFRNFGVILVDDCSSEEEDRNLERISSRYPFAEYLQTPQNMGFAGANNYGIRYALTKRPDAILLLNNDTVAAPDMLEKLLSARKEKTILTPKILCYDRKDRIWAAGTKIDTGFQICRNFHAGEPDCFSAGEVLSCDGVSFCCALLPAAVFAKTGLLDESYYMYNEDVDYCFRLQKEGYTFQCVTDAVIWHKDGGSGIGRSMKGAYLGMRNECYIRERYFADGKKYNLNLLKKVTFRRNIKKLLSMEHRMPDLSLGAIQAWRDGEKGRSYQHFRPYAVYVCETSYHVLITLIKAMKTQEPVQLILCTGGTLPEDILSRIKQSGIFADVKEELFLDEKDKMLDYSASLWKRHGDLQRQLDSFVSWQHQSWYEYYLYNDIGIMGKWLNSHKIKYTLLEDACDTYKLEAFKALNYKESSLRRWIKKSLGLGFYCYGASRYYKAIEVNSLDGILLKSRKLKEAPKAALFASLSDKEKMRILTIYLGNEKLAELEKQIGSAAKQKRSLLLTQPFYDDKMMSKEMHQKIYENVVREYAAYPLLIKPHPRDSFDYSAVFPDAVIIKMPYLPAEALGFIRNISVEQAVTVCSTAINGIPYAKEKVFLGMEYMTPFLKADTGFEQTWQFAKDLMAESGK